MVFRLAGFPVVSRFLAASWLGWALGLFRGLFRVARDRRRWCFLELVCWSHSLLLRFSSLAGVAAAPPVGGVSPPAVPASGGAGKEKEFRSSAIETL